MGPSAATNRSWWAWRRRLRAVAAGTAFGIATFGSGQAHAQSTIRNPGEHPSYAIELEPHALVGPFDPPGNTIGTGLGAGLRLTIPIVQNGFIKTINNSVGISFGVDWLHYSSDQNAGVGLCGQWVPGAGSMPVCVQLAGPNWGPANYLYVPAAMQWNFWLHPKFSAFGEPGIAIYYRKAAYESDGGFGLTPVFQLGGRWHFSDFAALTLRFGYPTFSLGVSFLL